MPFPPEQLKKISEIIMYEAFLNINKFCDDFINDAISIKKIYWIKIEK